MQKKKTRTYYNIYAFFLNVLPFYDSQTSQIVARPV